MKRHLGLRGLPASFAILISGATLVPQIIASALKFPGSARSPTRLHWNLTRSHSLRLVCTFLLGLLSFALLNQRHQQGYHVGVHAAAGLGTGVEGTAQSQDENESAIRDQLHVSRQVPLAGRTLDLTYFGAVRAVDICLRSLWSYYIPVKKSSSRAHRTAKRVDRIAAPVTFIASSYVIM